MRKIGLLPFIVALVACTPTPYAVRSGIASAQTTKPVTIPTGITVACYQQPLENLASWKARGCNAAVGPELGNPRRVTVKQWCDEAERLGLGIIGNKFIFEGAGYRSKNLIATVVSDEPTSANHNFPPAQIIAEAAAFRKLAPDLPVICNHAGDKLTSAGPRDYALYEQYTAAVDISWADWYPINREYARYPLTFKRDELVFLKARGAKIVGSAIECNWQQLNKASPKGRSPTPEEIEIEVKLAVDNGARWIVYFSTCDSGAYGWPASYDPTPPENVAAITAINATLTGGGTLPPPATQPVDSAIVALQTKVDEQTRTLATVAQGQKSVNDTLDRLRDVLNARAPPAAKSKPVYFVANAPGQRTPDWATPANWGMCGFYADSPTPRKQGDISPYFIPLENATAYGKLVAAGGVGFREMTINAGAPVVFDWESWYDPAIARQPANFTVEQALTIFRDQIRAFKAAAPGVKVGVYNFTHLGPSVTSEQSNAGLPADIVAKTIESERLTRIILDECDFVSPGAYLTANEWLERDLQAIRMTIRFLKFRFPSKAVYPFVRTGWEAERAPNWTPENPKRNNSQPLPAAVGKRLFDLCLTEADGAMIWGGSADTDSVYGAAAREQK